MNEIGLSGSSRPGIRLATNAIIVSIQVLPVMKSKGGRVAPAYDDDPDEPFFRHK